MDSQNHSNQEGEISEMPKFDKMNIRGGPGKIQAVLKSASDAQEGRDAYAEEHGVIGPPEVKGGPGKAEAVMESAGVGEDQKRPEVRGGPGKAEGVMESADVNEEQAKPVIRGGPGKAEAVMESAGEDGNELK
jgi:hypothetical protein